MKNEGMKRPLFVEIIKTILHVQHTEYFLFTLTKMRICSCSLEEFFDNLGFDVHVLPSAFIRISTNVCSCPSTETLPT